MTVLKISLKHLDKKQCLGNFCTLNNPRCEICAIDDALDELELRNQQHLRVISIPQFLTINPICIGKELKHAT